MKLPMGDRAVVDARKLQDYVLSRAHPIGRFKAAFFHALGFGPDDWRTLETALLAMAAGADAVTAAESRFGRKFVTRGTLVGPSGRSAEIVVVWIVRRGEDVPRFVTVYPGSIR